MPFFPLHKGGWGMSVIEEFTRSNVSRWNAIRGRFASIYTNEYIPQPPLWRGKKHTHFPRIAHLYFGICACQQMIVLFSLSSPTTWKLAVITKLFPSLMNHPRSAISRQSPPSCSLPHVHFFGALREQYCYFLKTKLLSGPTLHKLPDSGNNLKNTITISAYIQQWWAIPNYGFSYFIDFYL